MNRVEPTYDDWQEAYAEASFYLDHMTATAVGEVPAGELEAYRRLSNRLRQAAKRLKRSEKSPVA